MSKRQVHKEHRDRIEAWRKDAEGLSYEEAMQALDLLLAELQNDSVPLADLQQKVLHGEVYLSRCQTLLDSVEQSIVELDPTTLKAANDALSTALDLSASGRAGSDPALEGQPGIHRRKRWTGLRSGAIHRRCQQHSRITLLKR